MSQATTSRAIDVSVKAIFIMIPISMIVIAILTLLGPATGPGVYSSILVPDDLKPKVKGITAAETRWAMHPYSDYDVTMTVTCYPGSITPIRLRFHVLNSEVHNPEEISTAFPSGADCGARTWLPGASFATLRQTLKGYNTKTWRYEVEFDSEYGYVSSFSSQPKGEGIGTTIVLSDFQPVER